MPLTLLPVIPYPAIDPVLIQFGPFAIRWYALAYIAGIVLGWRLALRLARQPGSAVSERHLDDFVVWATLGVMLGGRLGYVLFYKPAYYLQNPLEALFLWHGGMSFHGGMLGVIAAMLLFAWRRGIPFLAFTDIVAAVTPIGLFFGRLANFINGELYGRVTDVPWAMVFPGETEPRHPSQLYQAALEGVLLFILLMGLRATVARRMGAGFVSGAFLAGYGMARIVGELFRQPDAHLGFIFAGVTMGQILSVPMVLLGIAVMIYAARRRE